MRKPLTREQFIAQFPIRLDPEWAEQAISQGILTPAEPHPIQFEGVTVYRALERLAIKADGNYYVSR